MTGEPRRRVRRSRRAGGRGHPGRRGSRSFPHGIASLPAAARNDGSWGSGWRAGPRDGRGGSRFGRAGGSSLGMRSDQSLPPLLGVPGSVKDGVEGDGSGSELVVHGAGERRTRARRNVSWTVACASGRRQIPFTQASTQLRSSSPRPTRRSSYQARASARSLTTSGLTTSSTATASSRSTADFVPREPRSGRARQRCLSPRQLLPVPLLDRHPLGIGREVVPQVFDQLELLRRTDVEHGDAVGAPDLLTRGCRS